MRELQHEVSIALKKVGIFDALKTAVGRALTSQQQLAVSARLAVSPTAFIDWLGTEEGRAAAHTLADAFVGDALEQKEGDL